MAFMGDFIRGREKERREGGREGGKEKERERERERESLLPLNIE